MTHANRGLRPLSGLALAALLLALPAVAQEPEEGDQGENCICFDEPGRHMESRIFDVGRSARLGVMLGDEQEVDGRMGVELEDVPEGTPARRAGLRAGDVIVALDGDDLGDEPIEAILDAMRDHEPGDTVAVTFFRDSDQRTVRVVTDEAAGYEFFSGVPGNLRVVPRANMQWLERGARPQVRTPHVVLRRLVGEDMELVAINPELGRHFGTDRGVLVAEIDSDSPLGLRTGDVILAIDGREVRDPGHARSIIASYLEDETITFRVVRDERTREVTGSRGD